jgi:hypothetical protein
MFDQVLIVLEVVIGLAFIYYVFSLLVQGATTLVLKISKMSANDLEVGLRDLLVDPVKLEEFKAHPLIQNLMIKKFKLFPKSGDSLDNTILTHVPPKTFVDAFLGVVMPDVSGKDTIIDVTKEIEKLQIDEHHKTKLISVLKTGRQDIKKVRGTLEIWFNDKMLVITDLYTRQAKTIALVAGFLITFLLGIDTIRLADYLWRVPTARAVVIEQVDTTLETEQTDTEVELTALLNENFPLFWDSTEINAPSFGWTMKVIGLGATGIAISQGSSFWYNIIKSLRGSKEEKQGSKKMDE